LLTQASGGQLLIYQDVYGLTPGQSYIISAWVASSNAANNGAGLLIHDTQNNNAVSTQINPGTGWQQISLTYTANSTEAMRVHLFQNQGSTTTYWDDVSVTPALPLNGGFETGLVSPWQGWGIALGTTPHSGSYGLTENPTSSNDVAFQDLYGLTPGQTYLISAWVASSSTSTGTVSIAVHDTQGNGLVQNIITPATSWQQFSQVYTVSANGAMRIHLYENAGSETTYWDDVTLTPLPPANAGFETGSLNAWLGWGTSIGTTARSGSYGLVEGPTTSSDVAYQDIYGLIPFQTYLVSAWVKSSVATSSQVALVAANNSTWAQKNATPTTNWQQVSQPFTVAADGWMRVHLYQLDGSETAYWDDVTVTPLPPANAGFESGTLGPWQGWGIALGTTPHSGSYGLIENPTSSTDVAFQDLYGLTPSQTYLVSVWVKSSSSVTGTVALAIHDTQGNGLVQHVITPATTWQQLTQTYTVSANGAMRIHLYENAGSETTYWDDVTVTDPSGQTPPSLFSTDTNVWGNLNNATLWDDTYFVSASPGSPAKEYVYFGNVVTAVENASH
jgi:hypothetical protein